MMTFEQAQTIRKLLSEGVRPKVIAIDMGVPYKAVSDVKVGITFKVDRAAVQEQARVDRVLAAKRKYPDASVRQIMIHSHVSFYNVRRILNEYK